MKHATLVLMTAVLAQAGSLTQLPQPKDTDASRADWKAPRPVDGAGVPGILEMVSAAVADSRR